MNDILYVTFKVEVADGEYYSTINQKGEAEVRVQVTREALDAIDPGNLLVGAMQAAMVQFDKPPAEEEETE